LIQKLIRREVIGRVSVTPDEVEEKLSEGNFSDENSYRLSEIFRKEKKEIEKIFQKIKGGKLKFDELAIDLGYFQKQELALEFQVVLPELKVGEVSKPIKRENGYYLICITEKKEEERNLEELRKKIQEEIFQKKFSQRYNKFIAELKKNAHVEIKNDE
jgi:parvulin-like peptidyl-prolyl isomerase